VDAAVTQTATGTGTPEKNNEKKITISDQQEHEE
jgi:hypothetical protein